MGEPRLVGGYLIEENVPFPKGYAAVIAKEMNINDSVVVETRSKANFVMAELRKRKRKGTARKVKDGFRVWRLS
tara:strand:+ start:3471 stop:3692 length:222 start_codon:yes stop_codon:yes gene_type:complete